MMYIQSLFNHLKIKTKVYYKCVRFLGCDMCWRNGTLYCIPHHMAGETMCKI